MRPYVVRGDPDGRSDITACDNHPFRKAEFRVVIGGRGVVHMMALCKECRDFAKRHATTKVHVSDL